MEDKELYILLGEIKAQLVEVKDAQRRSEEARKKSDERMTSMEKKINYAAGAIAISIFAFQAIWAWFTKRI